MIVAAVRRSSDHAYALNASRAFGALLVREALAQVLAAAIDADLAVSAVRADLALELILLAAAVAGGEQGQQEQEGEGQDLFHYALLGDGEASTSAARLGSALIVPGLDGPV